MLDWIRRVRLTHFSTYTGFIIWGLSCFMGHPTVANLVVMFVLLPPSIFLTIFLAHGEGKRSVKK